MANASHFTSAEYLNLHQENGQHAPLRPLKIATGVYIHAIEAEINGYTIQASFRVCDGVINEARLESNPPNQWQQAEAKMRGILFKAWQQQLLQNQRG